jgi:hypothetical protein
VTAPTDTASQQAALQQYAGLWLGVADQIDAISKKAAEADEAGKWGMDGWIRLIHDLLDLQLRTSVTVLKTAIAGPWWLPRPETEPDPEAFPVLAKGDARKFKIVKSFQRQGVPSEVIDDAKIVFDPVILQASNTQFTISVSDDDYIGANYIGIVGFTAATAGPDAPAEDQRQIIVGL